MMMIKKFELLIPPPLVALFFLLLAWLLGKWFGLVPFDLPPVWLYGMGFLLLVLGGFFMLAGVSSFRHAGTTVNPKQPQEASKLVTTGIFSVTRNPMYLGLFLLLMSFGLFFSSWVSLLLPVLFAGYINFFQIIPEEKILAKKFGKKYKDYCADVRRW